MRRSRFLTDLFRAISWHRRKLAVVAAVAAVLTGINAAAPPAPPTEPVVMSTTALPAGHRVQPGDVAVRAVIRSVVAEQVAHSPDVLVGRVLVAAVPAGAMLTELSVLSGRTVQTPGRVIAPVELTDAAVVALLRPGDLIDLIATDAQNGQTEVVVSGARVVTVPQTESDRSLSAPATANSGGLVLVEVGEASAVALAGAGSSGGFSAVLH